MRTEYIDMAELTDSREIMSQKEPQSIRIFILIVTALLIIAIIWSSFGKIDTYIKASGEVRPAETCSVLTLINGGKIEKKIYSDGDFVNKGDTILQLDCNYYIEQKNNIEDQISKKDMEISNYKKLISSIKQDKNLFDKQSESVYFYEFENYRIELENALAQIQSNNTQVAVSLKECDINIENSKLQLSETEKLCSEYELLYQAIDSGKTYSGNNETVKKVYDSYVSSYNKSYESYQSYKTAYEDLLENKSSGSVPESQIEQALYAMNVAKTDLNSVKTNTLVSINDTVSSLVQQINTLKTNIDSYTLKKSALTSDNTSETTKEKIKNSCYININNTISTKEQEVTVLKEQLESINQNIEQSYVVSECSGVLVYNVDFNEGDIISAGTTIASVVPETESYTIVVYIPEYSISEIRNNQKVEYIFDSISVSEFGKTYGKITKISADSFLDEASGQKFYKALATINKTTLTNVKGENRHLKTGMLVEVRAITGTQTIFSWLLDKLNFN